MSEFPERIEQRAKEGEFISQEEASELSREESKLYGGPVEGGAAAAAQSLHQKQQNYLDKVVDMTGKPLSEVTKEDAHDLHKKETRARAGVPPKRGSLSDQAREAAEMNQEKENG